jgi:hypothetical protein
MSHPVRPSLSDPMKRSKRTKNCTLTTIAMIKNVSVSLISLLPAMVF